MGVAILFWCFIVTFEIPTVQPASNQYYELWTTQFKSVQLELDILRGKVLEGEKNLSAMKTEFYQLAAVCSAKKSASVEKEDVEEEKPYHSIKTTSLVRAFGQEKLYVRQHLGRLEGLNKSVVAFSDQMEAIRQQNRDTENGLAEVVPMVTRLVEEQIKGISGEFEKKILELTEQVKRLSERLVTLDPIRREQQRLNEKVSQNSRSIGEIEGQSCQSGSFGDDSYPSIIFPKTFVVRFSPAFKNQPQFMYGLHIFDSTATVRINVQLLEVRMSFARLKIFSWADTKLYAAYVRWLACP